MIHPLSGQLVHTCTINNDDVGGCFSNYFDDVVGLHPATISIHSDDLYTCTLRELHVKDLCTYSSLEMYMHILCVVH